MGYFLPVYAGEKGNYLKIRTTRKNKTTQIHEILVDLNRSIIIVHQREKMTRGQEPAIFTRI